MTNCIIEEPLSCYNLTQFSALIHGGSTDPGETLFFFPVECFRVSDPLFSVLRALRMLGPLQARIPLAASIASLPVLLPSLVPVSSVSSQREVAKPTCSAVISTWALTSSQPGTRPRLSAFSQDLSQAPVLGSQHQLHCLHRHPSGSHQLHCLVLRGFPVLVQVLPLLRLLSP